MKEKAGFMKEINRVVKHLAILTKKREYLIYQYQNWNSLYYWRLAHIKVKIKKSYEQLYTQKFDSKPCHWKIHITKIYLYKNYHLYSHISIENWIHSLRTLRERNIQALWFNWKKHYTTRFKTLLSPILQSLSENRRGDTP